MKKNKPMQTESLDRNEVRDNFFYFIDMQTRWNDHDQYGHVNNSVYLSFMDALVMQFLITEHKIDVQHGAFKTFTVENMCRYHRQIAFPDTVECGLRVGKLGNTSVKYEIGLFTEQFPTAAATGYFVDVYVDAIDERPVEIPANVRQILASIAR